MEKLSGIDRAYVGLESDDVPPDFLSIITLDPSTFFVAVNKTVKGTLTRISTVISTVTVTPTPEPTAAAKKAKQHARRRDF